MLMLFLNRKKMSYSSVTISHQVIQSTCFACGCTVNSCSAVTVNWSCRFRIVYCLRTTFTSRKLPVLRWLFQVFAPQGQTTASLQPAKFYPNRPIFGNLCAEEPKITNFCNVFKERLPQIFLKFTGFMWDQSPHLLRIWWDLIHKS